MTETDETHAYAKKAKPLKEKKERKEKLPKPPKQKKKSKLRLILLIIAAILILLVAGYFIYRSQSAESYTTINVVGDTLTNGTIEITFTQASTVTEITGYEMDSDYVYVALCYTVKNISEEAITWEDYPLVSILDFTKEGTVYKAIEDTEADYDFNALQYYSIEMGIDYTTILDGLAAGEERVDADIFIIPVNEFDTDTQFITIENVDTLVQIEDTRTAEDSAE